MTYPTEEWVRKAEGDFNVVAVMRRSRKADRNDAICFHCQQCVEKYIKARLNVAKLSIPKTHDLELLLNLAPSLEPLWAGMRERLRRLSFSAVITRYPGKWASAKAATEAFLTCVKMRELVRQSLGLKP